VSKGSRQNRFVPLVKRLALGIKLLGYFRKQVLVGGDGDGPSRESLLSHLRACVLLYAGTPKGELKVPEIVGREAIGAEDLAL
jgi:hypothetical protein